MIDFDFSGLFTAFGVGISIIGGLLLAAGVLIIKSKRK